MRRTGTRAAARGAENWNEGGVGQHQRQERRGCDRVRRSLAILALRSPFGTSPFDSFAVRQFRPSAVSPFVSLALRLSASRSRFAPRLHSTESESPSAADRSQWLGSEVRVGIPACVTYAFVSIAYSRSA